MTRSAIRAEEDRANYGPDATNPRFNTRMSALRNKLRSLPILQEHHMAVFLIDDMIHYHFIHKEKRPEDLWYLLQQLWRYTGRMTGIDNRLIPQDPALVQCSKCLEWFPPDEMHPEHPEAHPHWKPEVLEAAKSMPPPEASFDPESNELKVAINHIIRAHDYFGSTQHCSCGKGFDAINKWSTHVRKLIYQAIEAHRDHASGDVQS